MSRIIVKNLPKTVTEQQLRDTFSAKGHVTDVQLKYTGDGRFRGFAFVGFKNAEVGDAAIEFFNGTFIGSNRAVVERCAALGSTEKPRAWSKYAADSSAHAKLHGDKKPKAGKEKPDKKKKEKKSSKANVTVDEKYKDVVSDPAFAEFLAVHEKGGAVWADGPLPAPQNGASAAGEDSSSDGESDVATKRGKVKKKPIQQNDEENSTSEAEADTAVTEKKASTKTKSAKGGDKSKTPQKPAAVRKFELQYTAKLTGLPASVKKRDVRQFLAPLKPRSLRLPPRTKSIAYVGLQTEKELKLVLNKHRTFMNGRRIEVRRHEERATSDGAAPPPWEEQRRRLQDVEPVAETGRIYVRNLAYSVTEDDLRELFSAHGELTEVSVPIDRYSRKVKGFAFITFVFPERAAAAVAALDGSVFQGRMLHLLPARPLKTDEEDGEAEGTDFKAQKDKQLKKQAGSSHNWNSLFLGANAVADLMAERYGVDKATVLDGAGAGSAAVRLALGETQLVAETRQFLEQQGVRLDAFAAPATQRSKTVILAKNLPAHTSPDQLRETFAKHGQLGRLVLPPGGVSAIIEFLEPSEARTAFRSLAYTRFKNGPLYLEWAPADALGEKPPEPEPKQEVNEEETEKETTDKTEKEEEEEEDVQGEEGATLFVKNLSFETTDASLREHFASCGALINAAVSRRRDAKRPGELLSQGYGFVTFRKKKHAQTALKQLQQSSLDGHVLELKVSNRTSAPAAAAAAVRKRPATKQKSAKILVRNVPFEAKKSEIVELFAAFGELAAVRLPPKQAGLGTGSHRGFAFVEFSTRPEAKRAFAALSGSTHLYGRRLVLEWAAADDDVDTLRMKTAAHFAGDAPSKKKLKMDDDSNTFTDYS